MITFALLFFKDGLDDNRNDHQKQGEKRNEHEIVDRDQAANCGGERVRAEVRRDAGAHPVCAERRAQAERAAEESAARVRGHSPPGRQRVVVMWLSG